MIKVLFICHGNICRSPMGEYILKDMVRKRGLSDLFHIQSCAVTSEEIGHDVYPPARRKLQQMGVDAPPRKAVKLTKSDYYKYDMLLCMENYHIEYAKRICGGDPDGKIIRLLDLTDKPGSIADPWYNGDFDTTYDELVYGCEAILKKFGF